MDEIVKNPAWISFKKFCIKNIDDLTSKKGMKGYLFNQFYKNLVPKEKKYSEELFDMLSKNGYLNVDSKQRIKISDSFVKKYLKISG